MNKSGSSINTNIPKDMKVSFPAGKGDKDTRTDPRRYRDALLWDNFGPDKKSTKPKNEQ